MSVPRRWWPGKPIPLSMEIAREARLSRVNWNRLKLGPGVIGHAAAEGGWYALIIYALIAGLYFRFFDEIIRNNPDSPFVILAVGSALGQFLGLPRGSVPNFAFIAVMTVTGSMHPSFTAPIAKQHEPTSTVILAATRPRNGMTAVFWSTSTLLGGGSKPTTNVPFASAGTSSTSVPAYRPCSGNGSGSDAVTLGS